MELAGERLTGLATQHPLTAAMLEGSEREPPACDAYEFLYGVDTAQVGFVQHPTIVMAGASLDRLVGADGLVELKCPTLREHLETLLSGEIPKGHRPQMRWRMACTGGAWCDCASWHPSVPLALRLQVKRRPRDEAQIAMDEEAVRALLGEVEARVSRVLAIGCGGRCRCRARDMRSARRRGGPSVNDQAIRLIPTSAGKCRVLDENQSELLGTPPDYASP
ncbi:YqaJ viral recombinase family protein [Methylobacterium phyllosphaerae]